MSTERRAGGTAGSVAPPAGGSRRPRSRETRARLTGLAFVTPYLVLLLGLGLTPTIYAIWESLSSSETAGGGGLDNYRRALTDFRFLPALVHVATFLAIYLPVMVIGVLVLALVMHQRQARIDRTYRLVYVLPGAVTGSASVLLWYVMLEPEYSPFGPALRAMGFHNGAEMFQNSHLAVIFASIAFVTGAGQWVTIQYGALQSIPRDLIEAALIDGCGPVRMAWSVKLPLVKKYVLYMLILAFAAGVQLFVEPQLLFAITKSAGSPWWSLNQLGLFYAFQNADFASAAAVSLLLLAVCTLGAVLLIRFTDFFQTEVHR